MWFWIVVLGVFLFGGLIGGLIVFLVLVTGKVQWEFVLGYIRYGYEYFGFGAGIGVALFVFYLIYNEYRLRDAKEKLTHLQIELEEKGKKLSLRETELLKEKEKLRFEKERLKEVWERIREEERKKVREEYMKKEEERLRELERKKWEEIRKTIRLVAKEQENVYRNALKACEKEMNSLRSRIHNQREHIKALERKIERLNNTINSIKGQFGARVIDIVKSAERNWILKGLKARNDLKLIKEKLRKM